MSRRVSLITLGVRDKERAWAFYEALGWHGIEESDDDPVFFQAGESVLALWDRDRLAVDSCVDDRGAWSGITFAHCVPSPEAVDRLTNTARQAGARVGREPAETSWGGYSAVVIDPDGHPWEIAYHPALQVTAEGAVRLAEPSGCWSSNVAADADLVANSARADAERSIDG